MTMLTHCAVCGRAADFHLLAAMAASSVSMRNNETLAPVCLPNVHKTAFVHAAVSFLGANIAPHADHSADNWHLGGPVPVPAAAAAYSTPPRQQGSSASSMHSSAPSTPRAAVDATCIESRPEDTSSTPAPGADTDTAPGTPSSVASRTDSQASEAEHVGISPARTASASVGGARANRSKRLNWMLAASRGTSRSLASIPTDAASNASDPSETGSHIDSSAHPTTAASEEAVGIGGGRAVAADGVRTPTQSRSRSIRSMSGSTRRRTCRPIQADSFVDTRPVYLIMVAANLDNLEELMTAKNTTALALLGQANRSRRARPQFATPRPLRQVRRAEDTVKDREWDGNPFSLPYHPLPPIEGLLTTIGHGGFHPGTEALLLVTTVALN